MTIFIVALFAVGYICRCRSRVATPVLRWAEHAEIEFEIVRNDIVQLSKSIVIECRNTKMVILRLGIIS